ncbi:hypothetical protein SSX86_023145 [Deinandra increscens subsp. villosa]|uniref:ADP-ribosyl cyclase/cyclic ADP-ribose hydrolase n=1 Tax=Deinandra increscens subsp. villosa TaxID=3103831 RepID=A0AAP0GS11_9ASTR
MVILTEISEESSSSSLSTYEYDVFLSFRGADTRYNFTDHLLKALREATIDTFFDDAEIQIGDFLKPELENAIKSSRASIIVLSKDYASSTWCLDELALIMEQRKTSKHIVFPIFYHVKPSDVRKQQNSFVDAMVKHIGRMEAESNVEKRSQLAQKIGKWKKALTEVADMKGEEANGRRPETILIEGIVKEIISRLDLHRRSEIPKLFGMESSVRTITSFLNNVSSQTTEFLTIWGMAGIGKTYLADYIFKSHYHEFESSSFVEDIERKGASPNGLLDLQKQLLKDIRARNWMDINDVNAGTLKIENSLSRKRILLVLDGVSKFEQLDALIGTQGLHIGSKIIITSKNSSLTEKCRLFETQVPPKHTKHLLEGLSDKESLQLLSWHAFGKNEPKESDKKQSLKVVKYCKGHPLALKVLGSSLRSEDATMDDILESLGKETYPDITKVLKLSFDTLPSDKDKELFKHIACLFVGEDRKYTEDILKACGICKSSGIKIIINRCLLTVDSLDNMMMHQLLQEMGRDIVRQESPKKPWKRSILWYHEECLDVLQNRQGTPMIQALFLDMRTLEKATLKESCDANMQICRELVKMGHFSGLPLLERLTLAGCTSLVEVSESVGDYCHELEDLDLSKCNRLKKLPRSIGKLKKLKILSINGCSNLGEFPTEMKEMEALKILNADNVKITLLVSSSAIVEAIPRSSKPFVISLPGSLVSLSLRNNNLRNESFPMDFSSLSMLKELRLDENPINSMPDCVRSLSRLEKLTFDRCHNLETILCAPNTLKYLNVYNCYSLEKITFHPDKSAPLAVTYFDASTMTEIQDKFKMQALSEIDKEVLSSLGWVNIEYFNYRGLSMADCDGCYHYIKKTIPTQMLYEHGIFSTYLQGQEVPKWFTHRSNGSTFTLQASPQNGNIKGINVCIAYTISRLMEVGPSRIELRNLTKNSSWTYNPIIYALEEDGEFKFGDEVVVWLSHWMFGENEFEDGDEVSIQFSVKYYYLHEEGFICYGGEGPDYANVREYAISLVYDDSGNQEEDPLGYYKSWKHIIGGDLSAAQISPTPLSVKLCSGNFNMEDELSMVVHPETLEGSQYITLAVHIVQRGVVGLLIEMLRSPDAQLRDTHNQTGIAHVGGISLLLKLLDSRNGSLQHNAPFALYVLTDNEDNVADLVRVGGVQKLQDGELIVQVTNSFNMEGIIIGILMDTQPLPIICPFGQEALVLISDLMDFHILNLASWVTGGKGSSLLSSIEVVYKTSVD